MERLRRSARESRIRRRVWSDTDPGHHDDSGCASQSGSLTIANDGPYGALTGKAATLDPVLGFGFDSRMVARPH